MDCSIVFCDIDGTLLNGDKKMLPGTLAAIHTLDENGIPLVIVSARSPSGIYPILDEYGFKCPIIAYSGSHFLDKDRNVLHSEGMSLKDAKEIVSYIESSGMDAAWNLYSEDTWLTADRSDPRVAEEEENVKAQAMEGRPEDLPLDAHINKLLVIGNPGSAPEIVRIFSGKFPQHDVVASWDNLVEILPKNINKGTAVRKMCELLGAPVGGSVAFGDYYNDVEMLQAAALPFIMGNAPEDLKARFSNVAPTNDEDGIARSLAAAGII